MDGSGKLDVEEFEKFLAKSGVFLTRQELRAIYNVYDTNFDGVISFKEFLEPLKVR